MTWLCDPRDKPTNPVKDPLETLAIRPSPEWAELALRAGECFVRLMELATKTTMVHR